MHVLLTGVTGTIGSEVLPRLLADGQTRVTLLIRAADGAAAAQRLAQLRRLWGAAVDDRALTRLQLQVGDIEQPALGLDEATQDALAASLTHVIHCAASVKLNMTLEQARASAVLPARSVLALAQRVRQRRGQAPKLDMVSTVGVWGRAPGVMPERPLPEVQTFHNTYEAAKAEAEQLLWAAAGDLPITVHRPSMVIGRRGDGQVQHFQVFYHLCEFLSGTRTFGVMPRLGQTRLDTVPVDWVAEALVWSSRTPATVGRVLHLCAGPDAALPLTDLQTRVRDRWKACGRPLPRLWTVDTRWLLRAIPLIGALGGSGARRALRALPPVLAYLAEEQAFGNRDSARMLAAAGLPVPRPADYLQPVLEYYLRQRGKPERAAEGS